MKILTNSILVLLASTAIFSFSAIASGEIYLSLKTLHQEVAEMAHKDTLVGDEKISGLTSNIPITSATVLAHRFKTLLPDVEFVITENAEQQISMCSDIAKQLIPALKEVDPSLSNNSELVGVMESLMVKISSSIDKQWVFQKGTANVSPPNGVSNATAGMNPDAISDPQLRKEYIDKIEAEHSKQLKNRQQAELRKARESILLTAASLISSKEQTSWKPEDVIKHFTSDEETKSILKLQIERLTK